MLFLIEYDRARGAIVNFVTFTESERIAAENSSLEMELTLSRKSMGADLF